MSATATATPPETLTPTPPAPVPAAVTPPEPPAPPAPAKDSQSDAEFFNSQIFADLGLVLEKDGKSFKAADSTPEPTGPPQPPSVSFGEMLANEKEEKALGMPGTPPETPAAPPAPATPPPAPPAPAPEPKPVVVSRAKPVEQSIQEAVNKAIDARSPVPPPAPPAPPKAPETPDAYEAGLLEEQREELALVRLAEQKLPDKYKGASANLLNYFKRYDAWVESAIKRDPETRFDNSNEELTAFVQRERPRMSHMDQLKLVRMQAADDATTSVRKEMQAEREQMQARQRVLEERPNLERITTEFSTGALNKLEATKDSPSLAEVVKTVREVGWEAARTKMPFHAPIVENVMRGGVALASEYAALSRGVRAYDPKNTDHVFLANFIARTGDATARAGEAKTVRILPNGARQTFLTRADYAQLAQREPAKLGQHFTLSDEDILSTLSDQVQREASHLVNQEMTRLTNAGFKWEPPGQTPAAVAIPAPVATPTPPVPPAVPPTHQNGQPPRAGNSVHPGAAAASSQGHRGGMMSNDDLALLGIKVP